MGAAASNAIGSGELFIPLDGEQLLSSFRQAVEIADEIGEFESWPIQAPYRNSLVEAIQDNPTLAESKVAACGLDKLLLDRAERERLSALTENYRGLDLGRFIGVEAKIKAESKDSIRAYETERYWLTKKTAAQIASLHPSKRFIRLAHGVLPFGGPDGQSVQSFAIGRFRWDVYPFSEETDDPVVSITLKR